MESGLRDFTMVKPMLEATRKIDQMVKGSIIGRMEITTKAVFWMVYVMGKVISRKERQEFSIEENTKTTKNVALER